MPDEKDPAEEKSLEALEPVPSEPRLQPTPSPAFISLLDHVDTLWSTFEPCSRSHCVFLRQTFNRRL